jgi:archaellum biogenesis protein FlaJ (TadC family)
VVEPILRALGGLIVGAAVSFALSVAAVLATALAAAGEVHWIAHLALPGIMVVVLAARTVHLLARHATPHDDTWVRARTIDSFDGRLAEILSVAVPLAWLVGGVAILVRHWMELHGLAVMVGLWLPLGGVLWILATFAWRDACRDRVGAAIDESDRRFRDYWRDIGQTS